MLKKTTTKQTNEKKETQQNSTAKGLRQVQR